jgi:hypothetical protein
MKLSMPRRTKTETSAPPVTAPWLLLVHQLPPKPAYLRVKVWRRLQGLGAMAVKNSVYVLPTSEQAREDFQWLLREIEHGGGEGMVCEASLVDGLSDQEVRGLFDTARDADYAQFTKELRGLAAVLKRRGARGKHAELKLQIAKLRRRLTEISAIDFFSATGRLTVEGLLTDIEARLADPSPPEQQEIDMAKQRSPDLKDKTWVTRSGVHVDRIACAWLIRRFIDTDARFKFVSAKSYDGKPGEIRFDMFKAEFTHEGDKCTFEVMLDRVGLKDAALRAIAEIVHDVDLKDGKYAREQAAGIAHVIAGVCMTQPDDMARIERGSALFDDTYEYFRRKRSR